MATNSFNIDVNVTIESQSPLFVSLSTVVINQTRYFEEFTLNKKDGSVMSLGFFPCLVSPPSPQIFLKLETFKLDYVYQTLYNQLDDQVLSRKISDEIVVETQRGMSQGFKQPLFIKVFVKLTPKPMPSYSAPSTKESEFEKTCAICWEDMSGRLEDYSHLTPNCSHLFHEECIVEWVSDRGNNSCPMCRQPVCSEGEELSESEGEELSESEGEEEESEGEA